MNHNEARTSRKTIFPSGMTLELQAGDITQTVCGAIVNAANENLAHGGGVAAAIVRKGGKEIQAESNQWVRDHGPISHNKPAFTSGGTLPCKFIIHAVGPRWGEGDEDRKLAQTIQSSLSLACDLHIESIAFPAISTGIFGFPVSHAAIIIINEIKSFSAEKEGSPIKQVILVLFDSETLNTFTVSFDSIFGESKKA